METFRKAFDNFYDLIKYPVFFVTGKNPKIAQKAFLNFCKGLYLTGFDKLAFDFDWKDNNPKISNAAGFNKNGDFPPQTLKYLGFDRVVVGTVTADYYKGNSPPTIKRFPKTGSMVNREGLPGIGAESVRANLKKYNSQVPLTINIMSTPGKTGRDKVEDLEKTVKILRDLDYVDRVELNVSCPNTKSCSGGLDARKEHRKELPALLGVRRLLKSYQEFYVKVSPDIDEEESEELIRLGIEYEVNGYTTTNTTTFHDSQFINISPFPGGASGNAVYPRAKKVQEMFYRKREELGLDFKIIACGGIDSLERLEERVSFGASEIQIYTPLIFSGPKLLREFRNNL